MTSTYFYESHVTKTLCNNKKQHELRTLLQKVMLYCATVETKKAPYYFSIDKVAVIQQYGTLT